MPPDAQPGNAEESESQLCLGCLVPNRIEAHFCEECGAPLSSYATTAPFERIFAEGHAYRAAVDRPHSFVIVFGVWLLFGMMGGTGIALLVWSRELGVASIFIGAFFVAISAAMIWKCTRNYFKAVPTGNAET